MQSFAPVDTRDDVTPATLIATLGAVNKPTIFKGLVAGWPVVQSARLGADALIDYLKARDNGRPTEALHQEPGGAGKFFYDADLTRFNFVRVSVPLSVTLELLRSLKGQTGTKHIYSHSVPLKEYLPSLESENRLDLPGIQAEPRIWIGNRSLTQLHFDLYDNLVCMIGGRKRFILFPPEQVPNLYMGPFETTVAGVPTSMVNLERPDFTAHPRFKEALKVALVADLDLGDVLFLPYMWWHHVDSSDDFNVQINYWWNPAGPDMGVVGLHALFHAMLAVRDLPPQQNAAWKAMFDHFIFHQSDPAVDHLPPEARGILGALTEEQRIALSKQIGRSLQK